MDKIIINGGDLSMARAFKVLAKLPEDDKLRDFIVFTEDKEFAEQKIADLAKNVPLLVPIPFEIVEIQEVEVQGE